MTDAELAEIFFGKITLELPVQFVPDICLSKHADTSNQAGWMYSEVDEKTLSIKIVISCGDSQYVNIIKTADSYKVEIPKSVKAVLGLTHRIKFSNLEIAQFIGHQYPNIGELYFAERITS